MRIAGVRRSHKTMDMKKMVLRKASVLGTAATFGAMNRMGVPHELAGFPWKLGVATIANVGEALTGGKTQAVLAGIGDSTMAIYVERSITTGSVIAGAAGAVEEVYVDEEGNQVSGPGEDGGNL